jgi:hypothetical protein
VGLDGGVVREDDLNVEGFHEMKSHMARTRFLERLEVAGLALATLTPVVGIEAMLDYYAEERFDGCVLKRDGDMLLFQWGVYDWGAGPAFEIDITRQLIDRNDEETEPQQLSLRFCFDAVLYPEGLKASNEWCRSTRKLGDFRAFISRSGAIQAVDEQLPAKVELRFNRV